MGRYVLGRLVQAVVAMLGVLTIVFIVMRFSGDPTLLLVPEGASREHVEALRHELGFDRPILVQFASYLGELAPLRLRRLGGGRVPATSIVGKRIPYTFTLAAGSTGDCIRRWRTSWSDDGRLARALARAAVGGPGPHGTIAADLSVRHPPDFDLRCASWVASRIRHRHLLGPRYAVNCSRRIVDVYVRPDGADCSRR